ncbi:uncharacterized protein UV8b_01172 [Ustilaginoidea virens]|uniref:Uncharacterized protein n=1 Tax=Ustilaginoidea virens TaxID=1159556 RepID=A0A8E5HK38_USTVR|nr:uncharacterized protein UV8b_01172 [Ustilaginoidea virens]QUC16931.1 hypothetical protein UV8b_01172 [Ustilaginoidea virens]
MCTNAHTGPSTPHATRHTPLRATVDALAKGYGPEAIRGLSQGIKPPIPLTVLRCSFCNGPGFKPIENRSLKGTLAD